MVKNILWSLVIILVLLLVGCGSDRNIPQDEPTDEVAMVTFDFNWPDGIPGRIFQYGRDNTQGVEWYMEECQDHVLFFHLFDIFIDSGIVGADELNEWLLPLREEERYLVRCLANLSTFIDHFSISREILQELVDNDIEWYARFGGDTLNILYSGNSALIDQFFSFENRAQISRETHERRRNYFSEQAPPEDEEEYLPRVRAAFDRYINFTSTWAKTDEYFFLSHSDGLYRLPFRDITQGEVIPVPNGNFVGVSGEYLFVSQASGDWGAFNCDTYRISLSTLEATLIDSGMYRGVPFFHAASNSILFVHDNVEAGWIGNPDGITVWFEALQLDTGERYTFFEFESNDGALGGMGWWQMENDAVLFTYSFHDGDLDHVFIDAELQAKNARYVEIDWGFAIWEDTQPQNPAEEFLSEIGIFPFGAFVMAGDWIFYLWNEVWNEHRWWYHGNLYRINLDGTQNTLLQEDTNIGGLWGVNNVLLAIVQAKPESDSYLYEFVILSQDGSVRKILGSGWDGHNSALGIERLADTNFVMAMQYNMFRSDGSIIALYCTETGAFFSTATPQN